MKLQMLQRKIVYIVVLIVLFPISGFGADATKAGNHEIEVINETVIRIRFLSDKVISSNPYLNTSSREVQKQITMGSEQTTIVTDNWTLRCAHNATMPLEGVSLEINGQVFSNLHAKDTQNFGGCVSAVDLWKGWKKTNTFGGEGTTMSMPDGILSRRGWTITSDMGDNLFVGANKNANEFYLFVYGRDYQKAINDFFLLTGKPPLLPRWAFGNWFARFQPWTPKDYKETLEGFRSRGMGLDVLFCDMNWHSENWFSMRYNTERFGDMSEFFKWSKSENIHLIFNHHPDGLEKSDPRSLEILKRAGLDPENVEDLVDESINKGLPTWKLNYRDPVVFKPYWDLMLKPLLDDGVDVHWIDGGPGLHCMKAYYDATQKEKPSERVAIFTRQARGLLSHRYPLAFSGDTWVSWASLQMTLEVSLAGSAHGLWWGHNVGGHKHGDKDDELYSRWMQVAALSSPMFLHSAGGRTMSDNRSLIRRPWLRGEEAEDVAQRFIQLRYALLPYFEMAYRDMYDTGRPLTCMMPIAFPDEDDAYNTNRDQFMLGQDLLVAPIMTKGVRGTASRQLWLPPGEWINWFSNQHYKGNQWLTVQSGINEIPMYQRAGAVIPVVQPALHSGAIDYVNMTLRIACPTTSINSESKLYEDDGLSLDYRTGENRRTAFHYSFNGTNKHVVTIDRAEGNFQGAIDERAWTLDFRNIDKPKTVTANSENLGKDAWSYDRKQRSLTVNLPVSSVQNAIVMGITCL